MDQAFILPGTFLIAAGVNLFCLPSKLSLGGLTSIGTVLQYLFGVRISVTNLVGNLLLFLIGWKSLGRAAVVKTLSGVVFLSLFLEVTRLFPVYTGDLLFAAVSGGALMGLGVGLVVRRGASTGGSDFAGLMLRRALPHVSIARLILIIDCVIVAIAGVAFRSWPVTFYSLVSLFISEKFTDLVATFGDSAKSVQIFSAQTEAIGAGARCDRHSRPGHVYRPRFADAAVRGEQQAAAHSGAAGAPRRPRRIFDRDRFA